MKSIYTVFYPEDNLTLNALELRVVGEKAVVMVQDRICIAYFVNEVWIIDKADECLLDLCNII